MAGVGLLQAAVFVPAPAGLFLPPTAAFFYRCYCWRHAVHDGGDGADAQEENLFSDRHWRQQRQGEAASSGHGFLCLFHPLWR